MRNEAEWGLTCARPRIRVYDEVGVESCAEVCQVCIYGLWGLKVFEKFNGGWGERV